MSEIWKDIPNFKGLYKASDFGNIKSLNYNGTGEEKIMTGYTNKVGYRYVRLCKSGSKKYYLIHRLIMLTFKGSCPKGYEVNHKYGIKGDNRLTELEYMTKKQNMKHRYSILGQKGTMLGKFGKDHVKSKKIGQYNLKGKLIKEWGSMADITRELGFSSSLISRVCNGKQKQTKNYKWNFIL